jgi:hypothetical protein
MSLSDPQQPLAEAPVEGELALLGQKAAADPASIRAYFEPMFAGTGGIDSWLGPDTPDAVFDRLARIEEEPLSCSQLGQLLILSHEAAPSDGFFEYYWSTALEHTYNVLVHGTDDGELQKRPIPPGSLVSSLYQLRWGLYRFYIDSLLYFGNVRAAYRSLREKKANRYRAATSARSSASAAADPKR